MKEKESIISCIPKPLLKDFINGNVVPFIGAGFSKNGEIESGLTMPDWNKLGKIAAEEINGYEYDNAIDALSYYESLYTRPKLVELLMDKLNYGKIHPGDTHKALCELFTGTICTTNYDTLIEDTIMTMGQQPSVIVTDDRLAISRKEERRIVKLHGDFNHPSKMVITENDYDLYIDKNPLFATFVANLFITHTMLLIGYSLDDADFRGIWQIVSNRLGKMAQPAYCILINAKENIIARFKRRNIQAINIISNNGYKKVLTNLFKELKEYVDSERIKSAKSSDNKVAEQMIIPAENNKLCFISCHYSKYARISEMLYPILKINKITPMKLDDILSPGYNILDSLDVAIKTAKAAIIDISESSQMLQYEQAKIIGQKCKNIIFICEQGSEVNFPAIGYPIAYYSKDYYLNKKFETQISDWLRKVYNVDYTVNNKNSNEYLTDAHRLYKMSEYSACVVLAHSELEQCIKNQFAKDNNNFKDNDLNNFRYLFYEIIDRYIPAKDQTKLRLRNKIVHEGYKANQKEASEFMEVVSTALNRIRNDNIV